MANNRSIEPKVIPDAPEPKAVIPDAPEPVKSRPPGALVSGKDAHDPLAHAPVRATTPDISLPAWIAVKALRPVDIAGFVAHCGATPKPRTAAAWAAAFSSFQKTPIK